jgi:hypothetical protein
MSLPAADAVGRTLRDGFPPTVSSVSQSGPSIPNNHLPAVATEATFGLFDMDHLRFTSSHLYKKSPGGFISVTSEADINSCVRIVLEDVISADEMGLKLSAEVQVFDLRPDEYIISLAADLPVGACEGKKDDVRGIGEHVSMTNPKILGEVFNQLMHLRNLFGVDIPFAILSSYENWRVFWLRDSESIALASATALPTTPASTAFSTPTSSPVRGNVTAQTPSMRSAGQLDQSSGGDGDSPMMSSPTKEVPAHNVSAREEDSDEAVAKEADAGPRSMYGSRIFPRDDPQLLQFVYTVLKKMSLAKVTRPTLEIATKLSRIVRVLEVNTHVWKHVTLTDGLRWDVYPRSGTKRFYIWDDLGHGAEGRALLASSAGGAVCVLKFFFRRVSSGKTVDVAAAAAAADAAAAKERAMWHSSYLGHVDSVRCVTLCGRRVLQMPHFAVPPRTQAVVELVRSTLQRDFDDRGLVHGDVRWRNIGLHRNSRNSGNSDNKDEEAVVYDMSSVRKKTAEDDGWINAAVVSLQRCVEQVDESASRETK